MSPQAAKAAHADAFARYRQAYDEQLQRVAAAG